jgi:1-acyl-sn-glycerol-3-phosphate acyltransferase
LPRRRSAATVTRIGARGIIRAAGLPLSVHGREHLPATGPCVLVVNHSSYLDGLVVLSLLRRDCCFVAKRELLEQPIPRLFLKRLGTLFVARDETREGLASAEAMANAVRAGEALVVFAEGTFTRIPGLRPFRLGGFLAAATTGAPTVPVAIRGTRSVLRDGQWFPERGPVSLDIGPPLAAPAGREPIAAALEIRDAARAYIAAHCGEPDLPSFG